MSLPGLSCEPPCPWMGNIPRATGAESGAQAGAIPSLCEWRPIHGGVSALETVARLGAVAAVCLLGLVVCGGVFCAVTPLAAAGLSLGQGGAAEPCREP